MEITIDGDRQIRLEELVQYRTYTGLLCGLPNRQINRRRIERALERARQILPAEPWLIEPAERVFGVPDGAKEPRVDLPGVVCIGVFRSPQPARDPDQVCSYLSLVWFQGDWALPIDAAVLEQIRAVDWEARATDATD